MKAQIQKVINIEYPPDKFEITGSEIFIYCPNGFGKTKLYINFFEKKRGVTGTARYWKTITAILQIAEKRWPQRDISAIFITRFAEPICKRFTFA